MTTSRFITDIIIHCAATKNGDSLFRPHPNGGASIPPVALIDDWHRQRGFKRSEENRKRHNPQLTSIGYHYVIYINGASVSGRAEWEIGAHVAGQNSRSIGICLIGTDKFTREQWAKLAELVKLLQKKYPRARVLGHRDYSPDKNGNGIVEPWEWTKICPGFTVADWLRGDMKPLVGHIFEEAGK